LDRPDALGAQAQPGMTGGRPGSGGGSAENGYEAAAPGIPDPAVAEAGQPSDPTSPTYGANAGATPEAGPPQPLEPPANGDTPGTEGAQGTQDEPQPSTSGSGFPPRPHSVLGWIAYPFLVFWRFLFPKKPRPFIVELPFLIVFALFLAFLIKTFLVQAFFIPSGSMQNTLAIHDRVLVNRASVWLGGQPQRGQVVVFQDPGGWLGPDETSTSSNWLTKALTFVGVLPQDNGDLIKRVIGVGGDHVVCCNAQGQITVNGVALNETYLYPGDSPGSGPDGTFDVTVPQGRLWVMGDHRGVSEDSRAHQELNGGTIPVSAVVGRAEVIIWPISHWATLPVPNTFKQTGLSTLSAPGGIPIAATVGALPVTMLRRRRKLRKLALRNPESRSSQTPERRHE
jgi:signal peptidase I